MLEINVKISLRSNKLNQKGYMILNKSNKPYKIIRLDSFIVSYN